MLIYSILRTGAYGEGGGIKLISNYDVHIRLFTTLY